MALIIRQNQIDTFDSSAERAFRARIAAYLRQRHSGSVIRFDGRHASVRELDERTLRDLIGVGLTRARAHGLTWQSSLNAFVTLMVTVSPNFDQHPEVRAVLAAAHCPPDFRMQELRERVSQQDWEAAAAAYDSKAWVPSA